jgi:hypothetical protein
MKKVGGENNSKSPKRVVKKPEYDIENQYGNIYNDTLTPDIENQVIPYSVKKSSPKTKRQSMKKPSMKKNKTIKNINKEVGMPKVSLVGTSHFIVVQPEGYTEVIKKKYMNEVHQSNDDGYGQFVEFTAGKKMKKSRKNKK